MTKLTLKAEKLRQELHATITDLLKKEGTYHGCSDVEILSVEP